MVRGNMYLLLLLRLLCAVISNRRTGGDQFGRDENNLAVEIGWIRCCAVRNICLCVRSTILSIIPFGRR